MVAQGTNWWPDYELTGNNGAHAIAMREYEVNGIKKVWITVVASRYSETEEERVTAFEWDDLWHRALRCSTTIVNDGGTDDWSPTIAMGAQGKHVFFDHDDFERDSEHIWYRGEDLQCTGRL